MAPSFRLIFTSIMAIMPVYALSAANNQPTGAAAAAIAFESSISNFIVEAQKLAGTTIEINYPAPTDIDPHPTVIKYKSVRTHVNQVALQAPANSNDNIDNTINDILHTVQPALDRLATVLDFIVKNPWVLAPLFVPLVNLWLAMIGFEAGGIVAGSIAAAIQSYIGNVKAKSLFAFLQSYGAGGFANIAISMAEWWLVIAVVLAAVGKLLLEHGMKNDDVAGFLGRVWNANIPSPNNTVPMLPIVTDAPVIDSAAVLGAGQVLLGILGVAWVAWAA